LEPLGRFELPIF